MILFERDGALQWLLSSPQDHAHRISISQSSPIDMSNTGRAIVAYFVLLVLALPIPLLHVFWTNSTIETLRPVIKGSDGQYVSMLMPMPFLFLRWLGEWSLLIPLILLLLLIRSFWAESLRQASLLFWVAVSLCAFATLYGFYAALMFGVVRDML
jgi:hypothetical protein